MFHLFSQQKRDPLFSVIFSLFCLFSVFLLKACNPFHSHCSEVKKTGCSGISLTGGTIRGEMKIQETHQHVYCCPSGHVVLHLDIITSRGMEHWLIQKHGKDAHLLEKSTEKMQHVSLSGCCPHTHLGCNSSLSHLS